MNGPPADKPAPRRRPATAARQPVGRADTKSRILDAGLALFAERGFDGVTTAEVAARAGVAEKTLFAHFGSKERLYQAALQPAKAWSAMVPEALRTLAPVLADPPTEPRALLRALLENRIRFARAHRREVRLLAQHVLLRPGGADQITEAWQQQLAPLILPLLEGLAANGSLRRDLPASAVVRFVATTALGYVLSAVVLRPDLVWDDEREIEQLVGMLVDGLSPR
jgi:AcrR family transcriptional regulator